MSTFGYLYIFAGFFLWMVIEVIVSNSKKDKDE